MNKLAGERQHGGGPITNPNWLELFPEPVKSILHQIPHHILSVVEEVRIREGRPLEINGAGSHHYVTVQSTLTLDADKAYKPQREVSRRLLDLISNHSLYTMEEELRKGFITIPGGHRIGLAGRTVLHAGHVEHIRDISGFNVRIAREVKGAADGILPFLIDREGNRIRHTLLLSAPQQGKTTLLRDLARQISSGMPGQGKSSLPGMKVGIVDERSEIAGCLKGVPSFDVGPRTDVMDACPKAEGMMMMIRSMSPDVLMVDEIGRGEDAESVTEALHAGITVVATAHAGGIEELKHRPALAGLVETGMFERYVLLKRKAQGLSCRILDQQHRPLQLQTGSQRGVNFLA